MCLGVHIVSEQPQANHMQMYAARTPDGQWPAGDTCEYEKGPTLDAFKYFRSSQTGALLDRYIRAPLYKRGAA